MITENRLQGYIDQSGMNEYTLSFFVNCESSVDFLCRNATP